MSVVVRVDLVDHRGELLVQIGALVDLQWEMQ
jgi:hypothetical protein